MTGGWCCFPADGKNYVYDTATTAIVEVPSAISSALEFCSGNSASPYAWQRGRTARGGTKAWLRDARRRGMFQPSTARDFSWALAVDPQQELASGLQGLLVGITEECNFRCDYCVYSGHYDGLRVHGPKRMTAAALARSLDFFLERATPRSHVAFYGGEPIIDWKLLTAAVEQIRRSNGPGAGIALHVNTNGSLLSAARIEFLINHDVGLTVSLDGPADVHDRMRHFAGGGSTHAKVLEGLARIHARSADWYRRRVQFNCLLHSPDLETLLRIDGYFSSDPLLRAMPVRAIFLRPGIQQSWAAEHRLGSLPAATPKQLGAAFLDRLLKDPDYDRCGPLGSVVESVFYRLACRTVELDGKPGWPAQMCYPGKDRLYVNADGQFFACQNLECRAGHIGDCYQGFDSVRVRELVEHFVNYAESACRNCWAYRICSVCAVNAQQDGSISREKLERVCDRERQAWSARFQAFVHIWNGEEAGRLAKHPASLHRLARRNSGKS